MKEYANRTDAYFRRSDTQVAKGLKKLSPEKGDAYRTSRRKDIIERAIALPLAIAATPAIGALALAVKLEDGGSSFRQEKRIGQNGKEITVYKIRSMHENAHLDEEANKANAQNGGRVEDPRATKIGKRIRKYKLDELPQLWQVVGGSLALFGMRASDSLTQDLMEKERPDTVHTYKEYYNAAKPGLVNPVTAFTSGGSKARYHANMFFARNESLGLDMYMLYKTFTNHFMKKRKTEQQVSHAQPKEVISWDS